MSTPPQPQITLPEIPDDIIEEMTTYLFNSGCIQPIPSTKRSITHIPTIITPTPVPKPFYDKIIFYQIGFNKLYSRLSEDFSFLKENLTPLINADPHIKRHLNLLDKVINNKNKPSISITLVKNDYTIEKNNKFIYQTNYKTLNTSFAIYTDLMEQFHSYFSERYPELYKQYTPENKMILPMNNPHYKGFIRSTYDTITKVLKDKYGSDDFQKMVIVFITSNDFSKRKLIQGEIQLIEKYIWTTYNIITKCMTFQEISKQCSYDKETNIYTYKSKPISMFYYYNDLDDKELNTENDWQIHEQIQMSTSIKIPDIQSYLSAHPLFQYLLTKNEVASKYLNSELLLNDLVRFYRVKMLFKEYDEQKQKELVQIVTDNLTKYIVKSQMKGTNSVCTGENILTVIPSSTCEITDELAHTVIEDKIELVENEGIMLVNGKATKVSLGSEYSVYGLIIKDGENYLENKVVGFSVKSEDRKKIEDCVVDESECAIDFPCLLDIEVNLQVEESKKEESATE